MDFNYSLSCEKNTLKLIVDHEFSDAEMAVYLNCNDEKIDDVWYTKNFEYQYEVPEDLMDTYFCCSVFIRVGSKVYSKKTKKINFFKTYKEIDLNVSVIEKMSDVNVVERYVSELAEKHDLTLYEFLNNFIKNNYKVDNLIFNDYIFIKYFLSELSITENWFNDHSSLGILNKSVEDELLMLSEKWYLDKKITSFTRSFVQGVFHIHSGDYDTSYLELTANPVPENFYFKGYFNGVKTYKAKIVKEKNFPYVISNKHFNIKNKITFVVSCNITYFNKFFNEFFDSLIKNYESFDIALALVNFSEADINNFLMVKDSIEKSHNVNVSYMFIKVDNHEKTLSACGRFILGNEILARSSSNILVLDLDVFFTKSSIDLLNDIIETEKISLSLKTNGQRLIPWVAVAAGANYFPNQNSSRAFLGNVVNYINYSYNSEYNWYLDQNALFYGLREHMHFYPLSGIRNIHKFTSSLLTKVVSSDIIKWKRSLVEKKRVKKVVSEINFHNSFDLDIFDNGYDIPVKFTKHLNPISTRTIIFLNGAMKPNFDVYPLYHRHTWGSKFQMNSLNIYDASLNLSQDYLLAWYQGVQANPLFLAIDNIINQLKNKLNLKNSELVFYGSSGGGWTALKLAEHFPGSLAVAVNPQISVLDYGIKTAVNKFLSVTYNDDNIDSIRDKYGSLLTINHDCFKQTNTEVSSQFLLVQNIQDTHHYNDHFLKFWGNFVKDPKKTGWDDQSHNYTILYDHPSGHGVETVEVIEEIINQLNNM